MTLRIQREIENQSVVFTLIGRIQTENIPELLALLAGEATEHDVLIDLKCVKLVDRDAVRFLVESEASGATFRNCPGYIREWITQEKNTMARKDLAE
jgi:hypothetical protein